MAQQVTPEKAIAYLDDCAKKYQGTREDHVILQVSVNTLQGVVKRLAEVIAENDALQAKLDELQGLPQAETAESS